MRKIDIAIIGAGSAGLSAVSEVRKITNNFLLINAGEYGTTCARVGCMPSKVLISVANDFHRRNKLEKTGIIGADKITIDIPTVMRHVRALRDGFVGGVKKGFSSDKTHNIKGFAKFIEPNLLEVDNQVIQAEKVIIATGSNPIVPDLWNKFKDYLITSDDIFELDDLPDSVAVVGLGVIGIELGQAMSRLGVNVVGLDMLETIAGISDPVILDKAIKIIENEFPLWLGKKAELSEENGKIRVTSGEKSQLVNKVLLSMGRKPNLEGLGLKEIGVLLDNQGIPVFDRNTMKIEGMPIYLAGDIIAERALLHEASDEGRIAGYNSVHEEQIKFKRRTPLGICFADPNIAFCGVKFSELSSINPVIGEIDFSVQGRAKVMQKNQGYLRLYACPNTGNILGTEIIAPAGEHLSHLISWSIQNKLDVFQMLKMPFYHPVIEEGLRTALRDIAKKIGGSKSEFEISECTGSCIDVLC